MVASQQPAVCIAFTAAVVKKHTFYILTDLKPQKDQHKRAETTNSLKYAWMKADKSQQRYVIITAINLTISLKSADI